MSADVAELADALDSKSGGRKAVWVRPPPSAPYRVTPCVELLDVWLQCCCTVSQVDALKRLQAETAELDTLLTTILDRAFKSPTSNEVTRRATPTRRALT